MKISDAMHRNVEWVEADTPVSKVAELMKQNDVGAIPVGKNDRLIGMITDRDLALRMLTDGRDPERTTAEDIMTPKIIWCRTDQTVEDALHLMEQKQIRRLPVLDEDKRMVGMLSVGDISHAVSRDLTGELMHAVSAHHA